MKLNEQKILKIIEEEWKKLLEDKESKIDVKIKDKNSEKLLIAPGLRVKHKDSGLKYTVNAVHPNEIVLKTPEGKEFIVSDQELEKEYEL